MKNAERFKLQLLVIPAKAGIHLDLEEASRIEMDSGFRLRRPRNDGKKVAA
jgi:hypothetical protein